MQIGDRILYLIEDRNITQKHLAMNLNIAVSTLNGYIKNRREPDYATLMRIATHFDVSLDYLIGYTNNKANVLTQFEGLFLQEFRMLRPDQQEFLFQQIKLLIKQNKKINSIMQI